MEPLVPYEPADLTEVLQFLERPDGAHIYLASRLSPPERGRGWIYREKAEMRGFGWIGAGRNVLLAGADDGFVRAMAEILATEESAWVMIVGRWTPVSHILDLYHRQTARRPRLDRSQKYYVQTRDTVSDLREPGLRRATPEDLDDLAAAAARMSAEDFEIDLSNINRPAVRAAVEVKIAEERSFVLRDRGELIFKTDLACRGPEGAQVEGVFTLESRRGRGIASRCLAELGHRVLDTIPRVTLHVATRNHAARTAYENAGFRHEGELRLCIYPARRM